MTNYYVRTGFVPERNKFLFTKSKLYEVVSYYVHTPTGPQIIANDGNKVTLFLPECAYLDGKKWEILEGISREDLVSLISQTKNSIFTVKFTKKDGSERKLTGMFGVKKHLKHGGERPPTVDTDKFFVIFDMFKKDYRAVNKDTIFEARIKGKNYIVENK